MFYKTCVCAKCLWGVFEVKYQQDLGQNTTTTLFFFIWLYFPTYVTFAQLTIRAIPNTLHLSEMPNMFFLPENVDQVLVMIAGSMAECT